MKLFNRATENYFVAHNCTITGEVRIGELSSFWFNAVVRGDVAPVTIGKRVNVQDGAIIHCVRAVNEEDLKYMRWLTPLYVALAERSLD